MGYFDERDSMNELMRAVAKFSCAGYVKGNEFDRAWPSINKDKVNSGVNAEMAAMIQRVHDVLSKQKAS
jgi:hypothetical protein